MREDKDKVDDSFIVEAIRPPERTGIERLVASELAMAHFSTPLDKIRHILEAYLLVPRESSDVLEVTEGEHRLYMKIYNITLSLSKATVHKIPNHEYVDIPWHFRDYEAPYHFHPWLGDITTYKTSRWMDTWDLKAKAYSYGEQLIQEGKHEELGISKGQFKRYIWFYHLCKYTDILTPTGYYDIQNQFVAWAMPIVLDLSRRLFTKLIDPDVFDSYITALGGGYGKKAKDAAKPY